MIKLINYILGFINIQIIKKSNLNQLNSTGYLPAKNTVKNAKKMGVSVCDYVEDLWDQKGETKKIIDNMEIFGAFNFDSPKICEIGTGTGRYTEMVIVKCNPSYYESYETALDWAEWLQEAYPIVSQPADGFSLNPTRDESINLVHAHGLFVYIPFFDSLRYFKEIDRITKKNSVIIFDSITEDCLDSDSLNSWINSKYNYPRIIPKKYIDKYFPKNKYKLVGNFFTPYGKGKSKYFVFKKY